MFIFLRSSFLPLPLITLGASNNMSPKAVIFVDQMSLAYVGLKLLVLCHSVVQRYTGCESRHNQDINTVKYICSIFYILILEQIMTSKANWACANCGMFSSRKASVKRHITNLHHGQGVLLSYIDYIVGRQSGFYAPGGSPNFYQQ